MRQVRRTAAGALGAALIATLVLPAVADDVVYLDRTRDRGFSLPGVALPQGQDEVRAADGTTCRSAVGGSGAYLDMGAIKDQMDTSGRDVSTYARVVVPLGRQSSRLDCSRLYQLEIERLEYEVRLMRMGLTAPGQSDDEPRSGSVRSVKADWTNDDGWSDDGVGDRGQADPTPVVKTTTKKGRRG